MHFRQATTNDIDAIAEIRKIQLQDEGQTPDINMDEDLRRFFHEKMDSGELIEWVAEEEGQIVATAAIVFMDFPPSFVNKTGRTGYVANMYTADHCRGRGIAGALMEQLEEEARRRDITRLLLHASDMGRKAYVKSGYEGTDLVMEKTIPAEIESGALEGVEL